jgi:MoaA/NifB/PqqE/SkfB family radical SAM enzyme
MLSKSISTSRKIEGTFKYLKNLSTGWPRLINLEVTKYCNARCNFCPCWTIKGYPQLKDYTPIMKKFRPIVLSLNGGEPLLRKDFVDIVHQVRPYATYLTMITHGQLLTEEKFKELVQAGIDQVTISLNYLSDKHDKERGIEDLFAHISDLVPRLTAQGYDQIVFNTVIMDKNLDQIIPIAKQAHKWGAKVNFSSYSEGKNDVPDHKIQGGQLNDLKQVIQELKSLREGQGNILSSDYYLDNVPTYFHNGKIDNCLAGHRFIQMTPDGYIKRCSETDVFCHWTEYDPALLEKPNPCDVCWLACRGETESPVTPKRILQYMKQ